MEIRILGPIEVSIGGTPVLLGGPRQRTVLALLATHAGEVVSSDRLIEDVWAGEAPDTARKSLQVYVSRLRKVLGPDAPLLTRPPGYELALDPDQLDAARFRRLATEGHRLVADDPVRAAEVLRDALALWRGPALHDLAGEIALAADIARLEEERTAALEDRIEADLALGRHAELVGELEALTGLLPLRERLTGQLMLALYRSGRQAEALRAYRTTRERLVEELGLDPSPELQLLEDRILDHDPRLDPSAPAAAVGRTDGHGPSVRGYELRGRIDADAWGTRYLGFQVSTGTQVVVKVIDRRWADQPEFIRRFEAEARRVEGLAARGLGDLVDHWRDQEGAYLVARRSAGATIEERLRDGRLSGAEADRVLERASAILAAAHAEGVVHGNLSASKVVIGADGDVAVADFGVVHDLVLGRAPSLEEELAVLAGLLDRTPAAVGRSAAGRPNTPEAPVTAPVPGGTAPLRPDNPYKGLRAFQEADADDFFGRDDLIDRLVEQLSRPGAEGRLVALVGPSGSGKSSVVRAGLLAAVEAGRVPGSDRWFTGRLTPGDRPLEELEATLLRLAVNPPPTLLEQLVDGEDGLHRAVARVLPAGDSELLLVIDQLEELFTLAEPDTADALLDLLAVAITARTSRLRLVVGIRSDFYDRPLLHPRFGELLRSGTVVVGPLSAEGLEAAVTGPSGRVGVGVEPAAVREMMTDVLGQPGSLPLLQYALTELFDRCDGRTLTLEGYRTIGGVQGALVARAEAVFAGLDERRRSAARQVFLRLVALDEGGDATRRRVTVGELGSLRLDPGAVEDVLARFGDARLLTFDRDRATRSPTVEVAHEALIGSWARLREWTEQAALDLSMQRRLARLTGEWVESGRRDEYLVAGSRLAELEEWRRSSLMTLTESERQYLEASDAHRSSQVQAEIERVTRQRDLERRSAGRLRLLVAVMAVASVVGLVLTLVALDRGRDARREAARAEAVGLSTAAVAAADVDAQLALHLGLRAASVAAAADLPLPAETEAALHLGLQAGRVAYPVEEADVVTLAAPGGPRGAYRMPAEGLLSRASASLTREMSEEECRTYLGSAECPPLDREVLGMALEPRALAEPQPLAGTTVSVLSAYGGPGLDGIAAGFGPFEEATGITVELVSRPDDPGTDLTGWLASGEIPDLLLLAQPAWIPELAADGQLVEIGGYLDEAAIERDFPPYVRSLHSVGADGSWPAPAGRLVGVPVHLTDKTLVWYPPAAFAEAGYRVPATWDELQGLVDRMVADGNVPWCLGEESGDADGWPATDWIEILLLGSSGPDAYDRWVRHEIPFDAPAVVDAAGAMGDIYFGRGHTEGGAAQAVEREFQFAGWPMFDDPPGCWLHRYGNDAVEVYPEGVEVGVDVSSFRLPSVDPSRSGVAMGGGSLVLALRDRPETRALVRYVASPEWGSGWVADPDHPMFIPANQAFDLGRLSDDVHRRYAEETRAALAADAFRWDASDLMPPEVGAGTFWAGMVDYLRAGPDSAEQVLARIQASWPTGG